MHINRSFTSPNYNDRPNSNIRFIILHFTEMTFENAMTRLCDENSSVSAHYVIKEDGEIFNIVPEDKRAFHAGKSFWDGFEKINDNSIGIELDNIGRKPFTKKQMRSCIDLCKSLMTKYNILPEHILGHSDIAPDRKIDPGIYFDWEMLSKEGLGMWPNTINDNNSLDCKDPSNIQKALQTLGYKIDITSEFDMQTNYVTRAFQLHFCPKSIFFLQKNLFDDNELYIWDEESTKILANLVDSKKNQKNQN